jgi:hypothetical protein
MSNINKSSMKKKSSLSLSVIVLLTVVACMGTKALAANRYSVATGNWNSTAVWSATSGGAPGAAVPVVGDDVTIEGGFTVTVNANTAALGSLTISFGSVLTVGGFTISVTGATNVTGTINFNNAAGAKTFTGDVTLNNGTIWNETAAAGMTFGGNFTNNATTFTVSTGLHTFSGTTKTLSGSTVLGIPSITFTGSYTNSGLITSATALTVTGVVLTNNGTITATTALSGTGGITQGTTGILNIAGASAITTLTANAVGNTVNYTGGAQTVHLGTYNNLTLTGTGAKTFPAGTTTVTGILSMEGTATTTLTGTLTYDVSATLQYNTATARTAGAEWLATFSGNLVITNTGLITSPAAGALTSGTLTVNSGASLTVQRPYTVSGNTTISGTTNWSSTNITPRQMTFNGDVTLNSGAVWTEVSGMANDLFTFAGNFTNNATTFTATSTGLHTFSGNGMTIGGATETSAPNITFTGSYTNTGVLTSSTALNITGAAVVLTNNSTINATTALSGTGGVTQGTTGVLNIGGTSAITTLTAIAAGNTVNFNGAAAQNACKVTTYYNLTLSGAGAKTFATSPTVSGVLSLEETASVVVTAGVVTYDTDATLQYNKPANYTATSEEWITPFSATGGVVIANNGTITANTAKVFNATAPLILQNGATLAMGGNLLTLNGDLLNYGATTSGTAGVIITGTATQNIGSFTNTGNVTMSKTGGTATFTGNVNGLGLIISGPGGTLNLGNGLTHTFTGVVTLTAGILDGGSSTLNENATSATAWGGTASVFIPSSGTVNFGSGGAQTLSATGTQTFNNLSFSNAGAKTTPATVIVNGNWDVTGASAALNTNNTSITVTGNITGTGATVFGSGTITVGGDWTNSGAFTQGTSIINYNGSYNGQLVRGGITYYDLQITNGGTKILGGTTTVSHVLGLFSGILKIYDYNLLLSNTATNAIGGTYSSSSHIQTNGTGYLQKQGAAWNSGGIGLNIIYPVGSGGFYNPLDLTTGFTATSGTGVLQISATAVDQGSNSLSKYWTLTVTNYAGINTNPRFTFENAEVHGTKSTYTPWFSIIPPGTAWTAAPGTPTLAGANPFGTNVTGATAASISGKWSAGTTAPGGATSSSFYSYQSGDWADASTWTADPSGTLWINPGVPGSIDTATILNGRTISINTNGKQVTALAILSGGILNINSTTGHNFGTVSGQGKLMLSTNIFPGGTFTNFIASNGGTIEYYNLNNTSMSTTQFTYNNLIVSNYSNSALSAFLINSANPTTYVINGNFSLKNYSSGSQSLFFGNTVPSNNLITMTVYGDFSVDAGCNIRVNNFAASQNIPNPSDEGTTPYPIHTLTLYGDFTNNGSVRFTGLPSPMVNAYYTLATTATGGVNYGDVQVYFSGATNNTVTCNGVTDFFRLIVSKGTDKTYTLEINSSSTNNFTLYGPNFQGNNAFDNPAGTKKCGYGVYYKALFIRAGTLKLNENINIPSLTEGGQDFNLIPEAALWINGATVSTTISGLNGTGYQAATLYGSMRISAGQFSTGDAAGLVLGTLGTPVIMLEGTGTLDVSQAWTNAGGTNLMSYIQTGGIANFRGLGEYHAGPMLGLTSIYSSFTMSGGTMNFTNVNADLHILNIQAQLGNYNVTGGTVNFNLPSGTIDSANSTVPFYNLNISNQTGTGTTTVRWNTNTPGSSLSAVHDLTINNLTLLDLNTNNLNLAVGHDFTIASGGTYSPATGAASMTTFNGSTSQAFNNIGTITGGALQNLAVSNLSTTSIINNNVTMNGSLTIDQNAVLNDSGKNVIVYGDVINNGTHTGRASGGIYLTGVAAQTINGAGTGIFNNLIVNKTGGSVTVANNISVKGNLRLVGTTGTPSIFNIGNYNLYLGPNAMVYSDMNVGTAFNNNRMIKTNGLLSNGGVSKTYSNTSAFVFPFGFGTYYLPASIQFSSAPATYGTVTIRPVNARHPLLLGTNNALTCYWKTSSSDFSGIPAGSVQHLYNYTTAFVVGAEASYVSNYYNSSAWLSDVSLSVNAGTHIISYSAANAADGEFTAGLASAFGAITTLYSIADGNWNAPGTWSTTRTGSAGSTFPDANTRVYICNGKTVKTTVSAASSSLTIEAGSTLDLQNIIGHGFGSIVNTDVTGSGTLRIASSGYFPTGDWANYLGISGGTVEYYQTATGTTLTIPLTNTSYYNLITSPYDGSSIILPNTNLTVYNNFTVGYSGMTTVSCITQINVDASSTTLEVKGDLNINQNGVLQYMNNTNPQYVIADNDINIASGGKFIVSNAGTVNLAHTLTVYGNILNNGTFDLDSNYPTNDNYHCTLTFTGLLNVSISNSTIPLLTRFYSITVNKGTTMDPVVNVNINNTGFQMGGGGLTLQNGTFRLTSNVTMALSSGGFTIPPTACLSTNGGTFNIATGAAAADLTLIGRLEIITGAVNIGPSITSGSANAYNILYPAAITPEIIISGGTLDVYSQIRRLTANNAGSLNYTQTGGKVTIGGKVPTTSRSVLEILNGGSKFTMSNGTLILANHINNNSPYDLYLDPDVENVTGGTIQFGLSPAATTSNIFTFKSLCSIGNIVLEATTNSSAIQEVYEVNLVGSLTIGGSSSYYNTNGLDVFIGGNLTNNNTTATANDLTVGGFQTQLSTQSTAFLGSSDQTLTGTTSNMTNFANLEVATAAGHTLFLSGATSNITVTSDLTLTSGTLDDGGSTINLQHNVDNNAVHYSPSSTSGGMVFIGSVNQGITGSGSGVFGNIEINNSGHNVNMTDNSTINGQLKLTGGYLYIDSYALTLGQVATLSASTFNATHQILLNGVAGDAGVTKIFPSSFSSSFTFHIGANGKYTPARFDFGSSNNAAGATIKVIPVDDLHPTIDATKYTNYLNYYWNVITTGFSSATYSVMHTYTYDPVDMQGSVTSSFIERSFNSNWSTVAGTITTSAPYQFYFSNAAFIDGTYTIGDQFVGLPTLYSIKTGNWNDPTVWDSSSTVPYKGGCVPNGHPVVIQSGHTVSLSANNAFASAVVITGILDAKNTTFHNIGSVSGSGILRLLGTGDHMFVFPGGSYDGFLANTASTVEYYGNVYATMPLTPGNIDKPYQNVLISGTGIKYISAVGIRINGNLTFSAGSSKLDNTLYNKDIYLLGNWIDNNTGTAGFTAGTGTVHFSGTTEQSITMNNNSMTETFYNLEINNSPGGGLFGKVTLATGNVDVTNRLLLTSGNIHTSSANNLTITNTSTNAVVGGSVNSFVNGPLRKYISNGSSFQFPVGDIVSSARNRFGYVTVSSTSTSGTQIWTAQFIDKNPTTDGYTTTNLASPLQSVVNNEYWSINGPTGGSANVLLSWDMYSGMSSSATTRASDTRVAEWNTPVASSWNSVGAVVTDNGQYSGTVATSTILSLGSHIFTIGSMSVSVVITSVTSGNWSTASTWDIKVPGPDDKVHISNGTIVTLNNNTSIAELTVIAGGTLANGNSNYTLSLFGDLILNGVWSNTGTGTSKISMASGTGTIFGSGSMVGTSTSILEIAANTIIDATSNLMLTNVSILANKKLSNNGSVTINALSTGGTFENKPGSTLSFTGANLDAITLTADACVNTVNFSGSVAQAIKITTYCNIIVSGSGEKSIIDGATLIAHGNVLQQSGTPLTVGTATWQIDGGLTTGPGFVNNGDISIGN